jgi:chlorobactene glucosyltransferase
MIVLACFWWALSAYLLFCAWENTRLFAQPPALDRQRRKWPKVSILIPARNEAKRIGPCLKGMLAQDYPRFEILVLDDRSTDGTLNVVRAYQKRKPSRGSGRAVDLKVFRGEELPKGWLGKPWACQQLAKKAQGEWLFFTDADTWHKPEMLRRTVQMAEARQADVLSLLTGQITKTWMEALVVPVMAFHLLAFLPARWTLNRKSRFSRFAGVSGQFVFIRRQVYRAFGGHEKVKDEIVEDLNFGKQLVQKGYKLVLGDGSAFSFCRMYTDAQEVWEGFSKNFFSSLGFEPFRLAVGLTFLILDGVIPFVILALGPGSLLFTPALVLCLILWGVRALQALRYGMSKISVFFHPVGCLLFALIGLNSARWYWFGKGHWKGRPLSVR